MHQTFPYIPYRLVAVSDPSFKCLYYTVGARIPNTFGIRMVDSVQIIVQTIRNPNMASLGRFI